MSEVVLDQLRSGLSALDSKDEDLAWEVIEGDHEINEMYLDLEKKCVDLIALQQPVAGDLRFIAATFKIITDLERIADLATNLGDYTLEADRDMFPDVDIQAIGDEVIGMIEDAMEAYASESADGCYAIAEYDDKVDAHCERASETVARELISRDGVDDEEEIDELMREVYRLLLTIRDLERVGDHAVNIAARTLYMVENDDDLLY
jgi:phosphate transport system protein